jgi:hypothetical protein
MVLSILGNVQTSTVMGKKKENEKKKEKRAKPAEDTDNILLLDRH